MLLRRRLKRVDLPQQRENEEDVNSCTPEVVAEIGLPELKFSDSLFISE